MVLMIFIYIHTPESMAEKVKFIVKMLAG